MSILGVNGALAGVYQYANKTQKTGARGTSFTDQLERRRTHQRWMLIRNISGQSMEM